MRHFKKSPCVTFRETDICGGKKMKYVNYGLLTFLYLWVNNICALGHSALQSDLYAMFAISAPSERHRWIGLW